METQVVPLHRCKCGQPARFMELEYQGEIVGTGRACWDCAQKVVADLDKVKPVFEAMIAAGISRELANEAMTFILDRHVFVGMNEE